VLAALLFGLGAVIQHEAVATSATDRGLELRTLIRQRRWLLGQTTTVLGSVVHILALGFAPVAIVQPLLAAELVIGLGVRALRDRRNLTAVEIIGALCTVIGLVGFLWSARPTRGGPEHLAAPGPLVATTSLAVTLVALSSRTPRGNAGALVCGTAAGIAAGVAAMLASAVFKEISITGWVGAAGVSLWWATIATALLAGTAAQIGGQQAYARGALGWSLPAVTVIDPLAAAATARVLLGERLQAGHAAVWGSAALVAIVGVFLLAQSTPHQRAPVTRRSDVHQGRRLLPGSPGPRRR
jgi:hypothetical protein